MMNLNDLRARCDALLEQVLEGDDEAYAERLWELRERLEKKNCLSRGNLSSTWKAAVKELKLTFSEQTELQAFIRQGEPVPGWLQFTDREGRQHRWEAPLDPLNESYFMLWGSVICKERWIGEFSETYVLKDGRWVYDASLERILTDTGYSLNSLRVILPEKG